jgi:hypothetical protein
VRVILVFQLLLLAFTVVQEEVHQNTLLKENTDAHRKVGVLECFILCLKFVYIIDEVSVNGMIHNYYLESIEHLNEVCGAEYLYYDNS